MNSTLPQRCLSYVVAQAHSADAPPHIHPRDVARALGEDPRAVGGALQVILCETLGIPKSQRAGYAAGVVRERLARENITALLDAVDRTYLAHITQAAAETLGIVKGEKETP